MSLIEAVYGGLLAEWSGPMSKFYTAVYLFLLMMGLSQVSPAAEPARHYALVSHSFSPSDGFLKIRQVQLTDLYKDLSQNRYWQLTDVEMNSDMGNPATHVAQFLSKVEQKLAQQEQIGDGQNVGLHGAEVGSANQSHPLEVTIFLSAHGDEDGFLEYYDSAAKQSLMMRYEDLWAVIDQGAQRLESKFGISPKLNVIVESCHSSSMSLSLQVHKWQAKNTKFNILASSASHELTYSSSMHTLLDLAFLINGSINGCKSCSTLEAAIKTASQIPLTQTVSFRNQNPQLYTVVKGRMRFFQFESMRFLQMMQEAFRLQSARGSGLKLTRTRFSLSRLEFFRKFKATLPVHHPARALFEPDTEESYIEIPSSVIELDSTEKMWSYWEPMFRKPWLSEHSALFAQALSWFVVQPETESRAHQLRSELRSKSMEIYAKFNGKVNTSADIVYDTLNLLRAGRVTDAIAQIPIFIENVENLEATEPSIYVRQTLETSFLNSWALAINDNLIKFGEKEELALKKLTPKVQIWFERKIKSQFYEMDRLNASMSIYPGFSRLFLKRIDIQSYKQDVITMLFTGHFKSWLSSVDKLAGAQLQINQMSKSTRRRLAEIDQYLMADRSRIEPPQNSVSREVSRRTSIGGMTCNGLFAR
jgi:hypothetical protein